MREKRPSAVVDQGPVVSAVELDAEDIVEQESGAFERRQAFEREHQRQRDVVGFLLFDQRVGEPGTDIGLAAATRRFDLVEAEAGHGTAQERRGFPHRGTIGAQPADEGVRLLLPMKGFSPITV